MRDRIWQRTAHEVITIDAQQADGNAFVSEYAGNSNVIKLAGDHPRACPGDTTSTP